MKKLLDLFCGAGGCSVGYHRAGFEVVGVDIKPQPHYPYTFIQADALTFPLIGFDAVHASPPCQKYSSLANLNKGKKYPDLVEPVRKKLKKSGLYYVIENVFNAPLVNTFVLCGSMFGLRVKRHRKFECNFFVMTPTCNHWGKTAPRGTFNNLKKHDFITCAGNGFSKRDGAVAMGIDWNMTREEMAEAIPPIYTEFIGNQLLPYLKGEGV